MKWSVPKEMKWLYLIAFCWYLGFWGILGHFIAPDTRGYYEIAHQLATHAIYGLPLSDGTLVHTALRPPLLPLAFAAIDIFARDLYLTCLFWSLVQLLYIPVLPCTAYWLGRKVSRAGGLLAYAFILLSGNVLLNALYVLSDTPFAVLCALAFVTLWVALERSSYRLIALTGVLAGLACLARPSIKYYAIVVLVLALVQVRPRLVALKLTGVYLLLFLLTMSPWLIRNYLVYGKLVTNTTQGGVLLYPLRPLMKSGSPEERLVDEYGKVGDTWKRNDVAMSAQAEAAAMRMIRQNPGWYARLWIGNVYRLTTSAFAFEELHERSFGWLKRWPNWDRRVYHLFCELRRVVRLAYTYLAPLGLILLLRRRRSLALFIGLNILYFTGLTALTGEYDRHRLNMESLYAVLITCPFVPTVWRKA